MSTQTEITRLQTARNTIRTWLVGLGLATSTDKLDALATKAAGIKNNGAVDAQVKEGESYNIPAGYHNGSGTVKGVAGGGNYQLQAKSVTPDAGYYGLSAVTVGAIPENYQDVSATTAEEGDVLANKVFIKADGSAAAGAMPNNGAIAQTMDGLSVTSVAIAAGYTSGGTVSLTNAIETALAAI